MVMCAKAGPRRAIGDLIEHLIALLDEIDGDPDFELEFLEEDHDLEADPMADTSAHRASMDFVMAEMARRQRKVLH